MNEPLELLSFFIFPTPLISSLSPLETKSTSVQGHSDVHGSQISTANKGVALWNQTNPSKVPKCEDKLQMYEK